SGPLKKTLPGEFRSTKKHGEGLGLSSVSNLVKKHNGVITVDSKDNVFRVSVILREQNPEQ
ncbi:MAG: GHKL domain-containing protein, partial [Clostridia bacterium]|nr:GHKL domain-containing protein [Clostridia bacterium]